MLPPPLDFPLSTAVRRVDSTPMLPPRLVCEVGAPMHQPVREEQPALLFSLEPTTLPLLPSRRQSLNLSSSSNAEEGSPPIHPPQASPHRSRPSEQALLQNREGLIQTGQLNPPSPLMKTDLLKRRTLLHEGQHLYALRCQFQSDNPLLLRCPTRTLLRRLLLPNGAQQFPTLAPVFKS